MSPSFHPKIPDFCSDASPCHCCLRTFDPRLAHEPIRRRDFHVRYIKAYVIDIDFHTQTVVCQPAFEQLKDERFNVFYDSDLGLLFPHLKGKASVAVLFEMSNCEIGVCATAGTAENVTEEIALREALPAAAHHLAHGFQINRQMTCQAGKCQWCIGKGAGLGC